MTDPWAISGWWIGAIGLILGLVGLWYGVWARSHPRKTELGIWVGETELGTPSGATLDVTLNGKPVADPVLVRFAVSHLGGPEIAASDMPADGITATSSKPSIVGRVGGNAAATYDPDTNTIAFTPRLIQKDDLMDVVFLADGLSDLKTSLRIANVTSFRPYNPFWTWVDQARDPRFVGFVGAVLFIWGAVITWTPRETPAPFPPSPGAALVSLGLAAMVASGLVGVVILIAETIAFLRRRKADQSRTPQGPPNGRAAGRAG